MVIGLPVISKVQDVCEGCVSGKMHREPFNKEKCGEQAIHLNLYTLMCVALCKMNLLMETDTLSPLLMIFQGCVWSTFSKISLMCSMYLRSSKLLLN